MFLISWDGVRRCGERPGGPLSAWESRLPEVRTRAETEGSYFSKAWRCLALCCLSDSAGRQEIELRLGPKRVTTH